MGPATLAWLHRSLFARRHKRRPFSTYPACAYSGALYGVVFIKVQSLYFHWRTVRAVTWRAGRARKGMRTRYSRQTEKRLSRIIFEDAARCERTPGEFWARLKIKDELARTRRDYWMKILWELMYGLQKLCRSHLSLRKRVARFLKKEPRHDRSCR